MRITSLELHNWKNFRHVEIDLPRRVFVIGPNASGKSNLLDVFRFLRDLVAVGGGLQQAVGSRGGVSALRCLAARRYADVEIAVSLGDDGNPKAWQYRIGFTQDNHQRPVLRFERVEQCGEMLLDRPTADDKADPIRLSQTYLEQVQANQAFREIADFLGQIHYLHIVPQLVRDPDRSVGRRNDPFGGDFLEQIASTPERTQQARLRRIGDALRVAVTQFKELTLVRDDHGTPHLQGKYEHWRPQGAWQGEDQFSDGTLRLLGLLWALLDRSGPLLLEEPELSLHPDVIHMIPRMFERIQRSYKRQIIVSTHSVDLLVDEGIGLDEVLLLEPSPEGTTVKPTSTLSDVRALLDNGATLGEAVLPKARPKNIQQLALFGS